MNKNIHCEKELYSKDYSQSTKIVLRVLDAAEVSLLSSLFLMVGIGSAELKTPAFPPSKSVVIFY
jgi:uncharacterized membrane protein YqhA